MLAILFFYATQPNQSKAPKQAEQPNLRWRHRLIYATKKSPEAGATTQPMVLAIG